MKKNYILDAWLVIALSLGFGAALAGVQSGLSARIAENKLNDSLSQVPALVPGSTRGVREVSDGRTVYQALDEAGQRAGWVVPGTGQGFADRIEVLVGMDAAAERITGIYVLDQKETPGLGDNVTRADWRSQFAGKSARSPLRVVKTGARSAEEIDGYTGATISSEAVTRAVNEAVARFRAARSDTPEVQP